MNDLLWIILQRNIARVNDYLWTSSKPNLSPWLAAVYVKEIFRHQGVATELIARCEAEAVRSNADTWYLYTEFASKLYEKLGWHHLERCEYKGVTVDVMCKQIVS